MGDFIKKMIFSFIILMNYFNVLSQNFAVTDDGKKIKLNSDGSWEYLVDESVNSATTYVFVGGKKLLAGERTVIHKEKNGLETSVSIAKDGEKTLIIFWQESTDSKINFFNILWSGTVNLYLENDESISLIDRNLKGQNKIVDGHVNEYGNLEDVYQRFSAYYLTSAECLKLKKSNLSKISYSTDDPAESGTTYLDIYENISTLKEQLISIKR